MLETLFTILACHPFIWFVNFTSLLLFWPFRYFLWSAVNCKINSSFLCCPKVCVLEHSLKWVDPLFSGVNILFLLFLFEKIESCVWYDIWENHLILFVGSYILPSQFEFRILSSGFYWAFLPKFTGHQLLVVCMNHFILLQLCFTCWDWFCHDFVLQYQILVDWLNLLSTFREQSRFFGDSLEKLRTQSSFSSIQILNTNLQVALLGLSRKNHFRWVLKLSHNFNQIPDRWKTTLSRHGVWSKIFHFFLGRELATGNSFIGLSLTWGWWELQWLLFWWWH